MDKFKIILFAKKSILPLSMPALLTAFLFNQLLAIMLYFKQQKTSL